MPSVLPSAAKTATEAFLYAYTPVSSNFTVTVFPSAQLTFFSSRLTDLSSFMPFTVKTTLIYSSLPTEVTFAVKS